jgi:Cys-tRNA(Pro)/Cys-tRNA(Cys) deacylase
MTNTRSKVGAGTPAVQALERAGVAFALHAYDFHGPEAGIALEAAALMGVAPARVLKTLKAVVDERMLVVTLVPADRDLQPESAGEWGGRQAGGDGGPTAGGTRDRLRQGRDQPVRATVALRSSTRACS